MGIRKPKQRRWDAAELKLMFQQLLEAVDHPGWETYQQADKILDAYNELQENERMEKLYA